MPLVCAANVLHTRENHQFHSVFYCLQCKRVTRLKPGLRTFASVSVPGGVKTTNQPNQLMEIALRLRLQQTEDLFIAGGVRFRLQLRCASLGGGEAQLHFDFNLAPRRGAKKGGLGFFGGGRISTSVSASSSQTRPGGGLVFRCASTSCGAKSRGRGSGGISFCMGEWSDFDFSFGFETQTSGGFTCILTSTYFSRCGG